MDDEDKAPAFVSNEVLWYMLTNLTKKVESLETKVLYMFGGFSSIGIALVVYDALHH